MVDDSLFPMVSVILPVRNEAGFIARSLSSVLAQDYPAGKMEILVVDGQSDDGTAEVVQQIAAKQDRFPIIILGNPRLIPPVALNIGIRYAKGEIIIRVDGHCEIMPNYVRHCVEHLKSDAMEAVGGSIVTVGETIKAKAIAQAMSSKFGVGNSFFRLRPSIQRFTDSVPFPAYRRELFDRIGYYNEEMLCNEDDEFNYRIRHMGGKILLATDIRSNYYCRNSITSLWRQYFRYGLWKIPLFQMYPHQMSLRQFAPPLLVLGLFISFILAIFSTIRPLSMIIPLAYIISNLIASIYISFRYDFHILPFLPFTFAVIHIGYGLGFLIGLFRFADRWGNKEIENPAI